MHFNLATAVILAGSFLPSSVVGLLDKPALRQNLDAFNPGLTKALKAPNFTSKKWPDGQIAQTCKDRANAENANLDKITTFEVTYADCGQSWILCRHDNAPQSIQKIFDLFGSIPVRMRQSIQSALFLPDSAPHAYTLGQNIVFFGDIPMMGVYIHETTHAMEFSDAFAAPAPLSSQPVWLNAYKQDKAVPDEYARTNQVENLAQFPGLALFDKLVQGGIKSIEPDVNKISNQLDVLKSQCKNGKHGGNLLDVSDIKCSTRWANPKSVPKSGGSASRVVKKRTADGIEDQRVRAREMGIQLYDDILAITSATKKTDCHF